MSVQFIALDGEMTAASIAMGGRIFQIGLVSIKKDENNNLIIQESFTATFNPGDDYLWEDEAEAVHGYTETEVLESKSAEIADEEIYNWLISQGVDPKRNPGIAVGFNVGSFDLPHIEIVLPKTFSLFSRRSVDINALLFTLDGVDFNGQASSWNAWKRMSKKYAERSILLGHNDMYMSAAHNALYDAYIHFYAWQFIQAAIKGTPLTIPGIPTKESDVRRALRELANRYNHIEISELTGVPTFVIKAWSNGGRAVRKEYIDSILKLVRN